VVLRRTILAMALTLTAAFTSESAAASEPTADLSAAPPAVKPAAVIEPARWTEEPICMRLKGAEACVGDDESDRPGIYIEDTASDKRHPAVEYYLNGYLGTLHVIHNLGGESEVRGTRQIGKMVTFRAAIYRGDRRVKAGRWQTVRNVTKHPVKRDTRVTPAAARAQAVACAATKGAALTCFTRKDTAVFACDTRTDKYQARAEYFVGGDPTARFEIHQLAGAGTCGKAEHGDLPVSMYRASVFHQNRRVATKWYKYH
jgi:hypothetical protein